MSARVTKLMEAIKAVAKLHFRNRQKVKDHIVCLPQDFYWAWQYGEQAILGTFTEETQRYKEVLEVAREIVNEGKDLRRNTIAHALGITYSGARQWIQKFSDNGAIVIVDRDKSGYLYAFSKDASQDETSIDVADLFALTDQWFKKRSILQFCSSKMRNKKFLEKKIVFRFPRYKTVKQRIAEIPESADPDDFADVMSRKGNKTIEFVGDSE